MLTCKGKVGGLTKAFLSSVMDWKWTAEHNDILEQIFQEVDDDDDGLISVEDLRDVLGVNTDEDEEELQRVLEDMEGGIEGGVDYVEFLQKFMEADN